MVEVTSQAVQLPDYCVSFASELGVDIKGSVQHVEPYRVIFELSTASVALRTSESLQDFQIHNGPDKLYSGRAVLVSLINNGSQWIAEAQLDGIWDDGVLSLPQGRTSGLSAGFAAFMDRWQRVYHILPEFKLVVADLQMLLLHMRQWMEQVELAVRAQPAGDRLALEQRVVAALRDPALESLAVLFQRFETAGAAVPPELRAVYAAYAKRQLHSLVLCAPFMYRTYQKPLGYAGDYEMVNMMMRDPQEGGSLFAKVLNCFFLQTAPVLAHRNRLTHLTAKLIDEAARLAEAGQPLRALSLGCGPALEVQEFLKQSHLSHRASFTLLDFNNETLVHAGDVLNQLKSNHQRDTSVNLLKMSIAQFIKEASKPTSALKSSRFNLIYCAGLFDYLPQHVCRMLLKIFHQMLSPGGLMLATNVDVSNPNRTWMELSVDWHLIYRDHKEMRALAPADVPPEDLAVTADPSGVNLFMEARKPPHG